MVIHLWQYSHKNAASLFLLHTHKSSILCYNDPVLQKYNVLMHCNYLQDIEKQMIFLTEPAPQYKDSFLEGLYEFQQEGRMLNYNPQRIQKDFTSFLGHLQIHKDRSKTSPHLVPTTEYWLI